MVTQRLGDPGVVPRVVDRVERDGARGDGLGQVEHIAGLDPREPDAAQRGLAERDQPIGLVRLAADLHQPAMDRRRGLRRDLLADDRADQVPNRSGFGSSRQGPIRSMIARKCGSTRRRCRTAAAHRFRGRAAGSGSRARVGRRRVVSMKRPATMVSSCANNGGTCYGRGEAAGKAPLPRRTAATRPATRSWTSFAREPPLPCMTRGPDDRSQNSWSWAATSIVARPWYFVVCCPDLSVRIPSQRRS